MTRVSKKVSTNLNKCLKNCFSGRQEPAYTVNTSLDYFPGLRELSLRELREEQQARCYKAQTAKPASTRKFLSTRGLALKLLTINEVSSSVLNVSRSTVYRLIDQGKLHRIRIKGCVRITSKSLESYLADLTRERF